VSTTNSVKRSQRRLRFLRSLRGVLPRGLHAAAMARQVERVRRERGLRDQGLIRRADCIFVSHPKSGRTWLRTLISRLYQERYQLASDQILEFDNFHNQNAAIPALFFTDDNYVNSVSADPAAKVDYRDKRVVFLARDPIDVAVSLYHQHANRTRLHKKDLNEIPYDMSERSLFEYVSEHPQGLRHVVDFLNGWEPNLKEMRELLLITYEELHAAPVDTLRRVMTFLGEEFSAEELERAVDFASADNLRALEARNFFNNSRLAPAAPGDPNSHKVRRARVGGYREDFTPEERERLEGFVREHLAPSFGYPGTW